MLCFWFVPGVITFIRSPMTIQVERSQGSRLTWASSSARITAPSGRAAISLWSATRTAASSGSPLATSRGRRQLACSRTRRARVARDIAGYPSRRRSCLTVHALVVVAVDPAANRVRVVLEEAGDLGGGEAADGEPDHDQAEREAPGTLEQGEDLELGVGGGLGKDVGRTQELTWPRWMWWKTPARLLFAPPLRRGPEGS